MQAELSSRLGAKQQAAYGVLCVTQMVNFHQLFCSFSTLGLEGTGSLQFPPISLEVTFQVFAFCSAVSLSVALFCLEVNTWLGIEKGFNC